MFDPSVITRANPTSEPSDAYAPITRLDSRTRRAIVSRERPGTQYASVERKA